MKLRLYQQKAIEMTHDWLRNNEGNVCVSMPTGSGKSIVIAEMCRNALQSWPDTRILMIVASKELISQNAAKLRMLWKNAPLGIYSAALNRRCLTEPITYAGIQSIRNRAAQIGHIDICLVDECDMIAHKEEGSYRKLINDLLAINPSMRVIGYTGTPYRQGHGLITDKPAIFDAIIEPVSILELIEQGYLSPLKSKVTMTNFDISGVHKRGGDYIESELQAVLDHDDKNLAVVDEVMTLAKDRKHWLVFCSGIEHAQHVSDAFKLRGVTSACLTGLTPTAERDAMLADFANGKIRCLTNCEILTVGYDMADLDCIVMLRPTMSVRLYVQIAGRLTRLKSHCKDGLFLDFAGVVQKHGPITCVQPPRKSGENGDPPLKSCPECHEILHISVQVCPECGHQFPPPKPKEYVLHTDCIMGGASELMVSSWVWRKHTSKQSGKDMLAVTYYGALSDAPITEYIVVLHDGYAGQKARQRLFDIASSACVTEGGLNTDSLDEMADNLNAAQPPNMIEYRKNGKFNEVLRRVW